MFVFGRILFDIEEQVYKSKKDNFDNYFDCYRGCYLVEMYKGIYDSTELPENLEVLIPRYFVTNKDKTIWNLAGFKKVDFEKVEFPEVVGTAFNENRLMRGELNFKNPITYPGILPSYDYPVVLVDICLALQGKENLIDGEYYHESLTDLDLLHHPKIRTEIYKEIAIDPDKSYYELSEERGFDLARFYE
ncbi:hypothetical protein [Chryseobacterium sp. Leaf394]|uniref:hypothetical protein n=1 Tax=Chryseobacterium sp. Leaf394 TaxID=1736361 RepID=UPI0006FCC7D7|nr:hypothetical protein [Chryseobacterium sp. Leaf394]KQS91263.1 hypothetical protein ASG21_01865 [Chryseobacterium sp. Leaf394]